MSIYQTKDHVSCLTMPFLHITLNRPVVGKQHCHIRNCNKPFIITELQLNLQKHIDICCCTLNEISIEKKTALQEKFDPTTNFDLMINFDFF